MDTNKIYEDYPRLKEKIETITRNFATLLERLDLIRSLDYRSEEIESHLEHALVHQLEMAEKNFCLEAFYQWEKEALLHAQNQRIYQRDLDDYNEQLAQEAFEEEVLRENITVEERALKYGMDYETFRDDDDS